MPFRRVIVGHALRNAMIAPFTVILLQINYLITGVVVVEMVFAYPGLRPHDARGGAVRATSPSSRRRRWSRSSSPSLTQIVGDSATAARPADPRLMTVDGTTDHRPAGAAGWPGIGSPGAPPRAAAVESPVGDDRHRAHPVLGAGRRAGALARALPAQRQDLAALARPDAARPRIGSAPTISAATSSRA